MVENKITKAFKEGVSVLLSVSLAFFLMIIVDRVPSITGFIFDLILVTLLYTGVIYLFNSLDIEKTFFVCVRTPIVILLTIFPYIVERTIANKATETTTITPLGHNGFFIYLIVICLAGLIWGFWEGGYKNDRFKFLDGVKDARTIISFVFLVLLVCYLVGGMILR